MSVIDAFSDRRRRKRFRLASDVNVIDQIKGEPIGKLIDIHEDGLMIFGRKLALNAPIQISLILPNLVNLQTDFSLGVECLWIQEADLSQDLYWAGCSIIDKSSSAEACIQTLINIQAS